MIKKTIKKKTKKELNIGQARIKNEGGEDSDSDWDLHNMTYKEYSGQGISLMPPWKCKFCTYDNQPDAKTCDMCNKPKVAP